MKNMPTSPQDDFAFSILDAGARFGLHESWAGYEGPAKYFLFEPDSEEANRLQQKYENNKNITVYASALGDHDGTLVLNQLKHRGATTALKPDNNSRYWKEVRPTTGVIQGTITVPLVSIDSWATQHSIGLDFLKIDVEGGEVAVLQGGKEQLQKHVLGVRAEVLFNSLYEGQPETFSDINRILASYGFVFLNFDNMFSNSQIPYSDLHVGNKYGQIIGADALWIKPPDHIVPNDQKKIDPAQVLKMAYFAIRNGAADLACHLLLRSAEKGVPMTLAAFSRKDPETSTTYVSALYELEREIAKLLFTLRDAPRYGGAYLSSVFESIFQKRWVDPGEYYIRYPLRAN